MEPEEIVSYIKSVAPGGVYACARSNSGSAAQMANALTQALGLSGIRCSRVDGVHFVQQRPSVVIAWSWKLCEPIRQRGHFPVLMERGYVGDRMQYTSIAAGGLNGRGKYAVEPGSEHWQPGRLEKVLGGPLCDPLPVDQEAPVLLCGQVLGDASLGGRSAVQMHDIYQGVVDEYKRAGKSVQFREHPLYKGPARTFRGAESSTHASLGAAVAQSSLVVAWNSNAMVDAVVAGRRVRALDPDGSVLGECLDQSLSPDDWARARVRDLESVAHMQWLPEEVATGRDFPASDAVLLSIADGLYFQKQSKNRNPWHG